MIGRNGKFCTWSKPTWYRKKWKVWFYWLGACVFSEKYGTEKEAQEAINDYMYRIG